VGTVLVRVPLNRPPKSQHPLINRDAWVGVLKKVTDYELELAACGHIKAYSLVFICLFRKEVGL